MHSRPLFRRGFLLLQSAGLFSHLQSVAKIDEDNQISSLISAFAQIWPCSFLTRCLFELSLRASCSSISLCLQPCRGLHLELTSRRAKRGRWGKAVRLISLAALSWFSRWLLCLSFCPWKFYLSSACAFVWLFSSQWVEQLVEVPDRWRVPVFQLLISLQHHLYCLPSIVVPQDLIAVIEVLQFYSISPQDILQKWQPVRKVDLTCPSGRWDKLIGSTWHSYFVQSTYCFGRISLRF